MTSFSYTYRARSSVGKSARSHALGNTQWIVVSMSSRQPTPRRHHVAIGVGQKLYIWGGEGDLLRIQPTSVQTFNVLLGTWERPQQLHGSLPDSLYDVAYTSDGHIAYFFGGREGFLYNDTLYEIDLSTLNSRQLVPANPSCAPKITSGSRMVYYSQQLVLYGGSRGHDQHDGLHVFDLKTSELEGDLVER